MNVTLIIRTNDFNNRRAPPSIATFFYLQLKPLLIGPSYLNCFVSKFAFLRVDISRLFMFIRIRSFVYRNKFSVNSYRIFSFICFSCQIRRGFNCMYVSYSEIIMIYQTHHLPLAQLTNYHQQVLF